MPEPIRIRTIRKRPEKQSGNAAWMHDLTPVRPDPSIFNGEDAIQSLKVWPVDLPAPETAQALRILKVDAQEGEDLPPVA